MENLIFDRTQNDVENGTSKGYYNYTDLNRVETWCEYLADLLNSYSYPVSISIKKNWNMSDLPNVNDMERIRCNVNVIKTAFYSYTDIPENLNRNFLIGEMLDSSEENKKVSTEFEIDISEKELLAEKEELSMRSCNSTEVQIVLRNPAWAYVYWNISDSDRTSLEKAFVSQMMIRVSSFSEKEQINIAILIYQKKILDSTFCFLLEKSSLGWIFFSILTEL